MPRVNRIDPTVDPESYAQIEARYLSFLENAGDVTKPVIKVFNPLSKKHIDELELCRELTKTLMQKKDDDILKQKQQAEEAEREMKEAKRLAAEKKEAEVKEGETTEATDGKEVVDEEKSDELNKKIE